MNKKLNSTAAYYQGIKGEQIALKYLLEQNYQILEKRYKTEHGEIDIIAKAEEYIVFIEVKIRGKIDDSLQSISKGQQKRIINAALIYLDNNNLNPNAQNIRFDVFAIENEGRFEHLINVNFG
jgi:putative endonuclease